MKSIVVFISLFIIACVHAHGAVICVQNKATGVFEVKNGGTLRAASPGECNVKALQAALNDGPTAAPQAPVTPSTPTIPPKRWEVRVSDVRLSATFERWAREAVVEGRVPAGFKMLWDADRHVLIDATPAYGGTILEAIEQALSTPAIRHSPYPLEACVYENSPPLVRITKRGDQTEACPDSK